MEDASHPKWLFAIILLIVIAVVAFVVLRAEKIDILDLAINSSVFFEAILTFITGAGGFVVGRIIYDWLKRPKLKIIRPDFVTDVKGQKYWRVIVRNEGRTAAESCTGCIHLLGTDSTGNRIDVKGGVPWSIIGNPGRIDLNVQDEQALDIFMISLGRDQVIEPESRAGFLRIPTERGWQYYRRELPLSNISDFLRVKVKITAKNAAPCVRKFLIKKQDGELIIVPENGTN